MKSNLIKFFIVLIVFLLTQNILNAQNPIYKIENKINLPENENICFISDNDDKIFIITYERMIGNKFKSIKIKTFDKGKIAKTKNIGLKYNGSQLIFSPDKNYFLIRNSDDDRYTKFFLFNLNGEIVVEKHFPTDQEFTNAPYLGDNFFVINTSNGLNIFNLQGQLVKKIAFNKIVNNFDKESLRDVFITDDVIYLAINYAEISEEDRSVTYKCLLYEYNIKKDAERVVTSFDNYQEIQQLEFDSSNRNLFLVLRESYGGFSHHILRVSENGQIDIVYKDYKIAEIETYGDYLAIKKHKSLKVLNNNTETIINDNVPHYAYNSVIQDNKIYYITYEKDIPTRRGQKIFAHDINLIIHDLITTEKNVIPLINEIDTVFLFPLDVIVKNEKIIVTFLNNLFQISTF